MKILLLGGTGQIGCAIAESLSKSRHRTTLLVRREKKSLPYAQNLQFIFAPTFQATDFRNALRGIDLAIYGVGLPEQWTRDSSVFERVNLNLFRVFLDQAVRMKLKRLIYISTYEVFSDLAGKIRENQSLLKEHVSPYFNAMIQAYRMAREYEKRHGLSIISIHPAAVYGGINTGAGATEYLENIMRRRYWRVPTIFPTRFPAIHVDSLADGVLKVMENGKWGGAYLFSDTMTSLKDLAETARNVFPKAYVPPRIPVWLARLVAVFAEILSRLTHRPPLVSKAQIDFLSKGLEPMTGKAKKNLSWRPMKLETGIRRMLPSLLA